MASPVIRSHHESVTIPDSVLLGEYMLDKINSWKTKASLVENGRVWSFADVARRSRQLAMNMESIYGLRHGDVVALLLPNCAAYAVWMLGVMLARGVVTTINPVYTAHEILHQLRDSRAKYIVTVPEWLHKVAEIRHEHPTRFTFTVGDAEGAIPFESLCQGDDQIWIPPRYPFNPRTELAVLPYSSGTTGLSKGVMLSHYNLISNLEQMQHEFSSDDVLCGVLPFFHIYGMIVVLLGALRNGATLVIMPSFDLEKYLNICRDYKVTLGHIVPPIAVALAKHPMVEKYLPIHVKRFFSGAAPMGPELEAEVSKRINAVVKQAYGMTELSPVSHMVPGYQTRPGSCGVLVPNTEAMIVGIDDGTPLGPGKEGELWIRGPQVMMGYLNNTEATHVTIDADGWLHTGDIAKVDEDGYFYILDRVKELIKYKGFQVPPAELEELLLTHPAVADVAVIPIPDQEVGDLPKAFVVLKPNAQATAEELMKFVEERVAHYKRIRLLEFTTTIPKSGSGKILRRVLKDLEKQRKLQRAKL
eukprot:TRINITY_DN1267_c0_g1_i1.p1 TRINITY_DN1267_c0_g1~~TRINITY_DN1267_c0_g1_i1.p1  ORF type:complete len:531 (+),score=114.30 TRINITY_DN1267_c0_g1_i1:59-1651(+)